MEKRYREPSREYIAEKRKQYHERVIIFSNYKKIATSELKSSSDIVDAIIVRVHQRIDYYSYFHGKELKQTRQSALRAYWILKYRPLRALYWDNEYDINVHFAFFELFATSITEYKTECTKEVISRVINIVLKDYEKDYLRALSEYDISKEAMMLITDSLRSVVKGEIKSLN